MSKIAKFVRWVGVLSCVVILAACGGKAAPPPPPPALGASTLGSAGGVVDGPDGTRLTIAPNSVATNTTFRIARSASGAPELIGLNLASPVYEVTPHNAELRQSALFTLPLSAAELPPGAVPILLKSSPGQPWRVVQDTGRVPNALSTDLNTLSWFVIGYCISGNNAGEGAWVIGTPACPSNNTLKLELLNASGTPITVRPGNDGLLPPYVTIDGPAPVTLNFRLTWTRPAGTDRVDGVSVVGSPRGFGPGFTSTWRSFPPVIEVNGSFTSDFSVTIDPTVQVGSFIRDLRVMAFATYSTTALSVGRGPVNAGFQFETYIPIRVAYTVPSPVITQEPLPAAVSVAENNSFTLTAAATGGNLSYEWRYFDDVTSPAPGKLAEGVANRATYTSPPAPLSWSGRLYFADICSNRESPGLRRCVQTQASPLTVTPFTAPSSILTQPVPRDILEGESTSFAATVSGTPTPTLQWHYGVNCSTNAAGASTCSGTPFANGAGRGVFGGATIGGALEQTLRLVSVPVSANGTQIALRVSQPGQPTLWTTPVALTVRQRPAPAAISQPLVTPRTVQQGGSLDFTMQATGTGPISYLWSIDGLRVTGPGIARTGRCTGLTASFPSDGVMRLSNVPILCDGSSISVAVENVATPVGGRPTSTALLSVTPPVGAPTINSQPSDQLTSVGGSASFTVGVVGNPPPTVSWRIGAQPLSASGTYASGSCTFTYTTGSNGQPLNLSGVSQGCSGSQFSAVVTNSGGSATTNTVTLTVTAPAPSITQQPQDLTVGAGQTATFTAAAANAPFVQWQRDGAFITGATALTYTINAASLGDNGARFRMVACTEPVPGGTCVQTNAVTLTVTPPPSVTQQPQSIIVNAGQPARFNAQVANAPFVQWQRDGVLIPGATASTYTLSAPTTADSGARFSLLACNQPIPAGQCVTTNQAVLTVNPATSGAPVISTQPTNQSTTEGGSASFSFVVTGQPSPTIDWRVSLIPVPLATSGSFNSGGCSFTYAQADQGQRLNLTAVSIGCAGVSFRAVATNNQGSATTNTVTLAVNAAPPLSLGACFGTLQGWCYVQPRPMANHLAALAFDGNGGFTAVGSAGTVIASPDFGDTFTTSWQPSRGDFLSLVSPSPGRLLATIRLPNGASDLNRSTDGGATWDPLNTPVAGPAFKDAFVGVGLGRDGIYRSTDGGNTWTLLNVPALGAASAFQRTGLAYAGNDVFVLSGVGKALRSTDAGQTWTDLPSLVAAAPNIRNVVFNGTGVGLALGDNQPIAMQTTDFGATWNLVNLPFAATYAAYGDANTVVILNDVNSSHSRSVDGGQTWSAETTSMPIGQQNWRPYMSSAQEGIAVGLYGAIARTTDGGQSWTLVAGGNINRSVYAIEANPSGSVLLAQINNALQRSTDGLTWNDAASTPLFAFGRSISWATDTVAAVTTSLEGVQVTSDAGNTWTQVRPPNTNGAWNGVGMASDQVILLHGYDLVNGNVQAFVERSTNRGQSWSRVNVPGLSGANVEFAAVRFTSPLVGFIGGDGPRLWRTTDGGASWSQISLPQFGVGGTPDFVFSINPGPTGTLLLATNSGLLRSTDAGLTWTVALDTTSAGGMAGAKCNGNTCIGVGSNSIWRSTNGGINWTRLDVPLGYSLNAVSWLPNDIVLVGGDGGALLINRSAGALAVRPENRSFKQTLRVSPANITRRMNIAPPRTRTTIPLRKQGSAVIMGAPVDARGRPQGPAQAPQGSQMQALKGKVRIGNQWVVAPRAILPREVRSPRAAVEPPQR